MRDYYGQGCTDACALFDIKLAGFTAQSANRALARAPSGEEAQRAAMLKKINATATSSPKGQRTRWEDVPDRPQMGASFSLQDMFGPNWAQKVNPAEMHRMAGVPVAGAQGGVQPAAGPSVRPAPLSPGTGPQRAAAKAPTAATFVGAPQRAV